MNYEILWKIENIILLRRDNVIARDTDSNKIYTVYHRRTK